MTDEIHTNKLNKKVPGEPNFRIKVPEGWKVIEDADLLFIAKKEFVDLDIKLIIIKNWKSFSNYPYIVELKLEWDAVKYPDRIALIKEKSFDTEHEQDREINLLLTRCDTSYASSLIEEYEKNLKEQENLKERELKAKKRAESKPEKKECSNDFKDMSLTQRIHKIAEQAVLCYGSKEKDEEIEKYLPFLQDPKLFQKITSTMNKLAYGEEHTKQILFLSYLSYRLKKSLAIIVSGDSAVGKTEITEQVMKLMPLEEGRDFINITRLTPSVLDRLDMVDFSNMFIYIDEMDGIVDENVQAKLRLLISKGYLSLLESVKDETGAFIVRQTIVGSKNTSPFIITTTANAKVEHQMSTRVIHLAIASTPKYLQKVQEFIINNKDINILEEKTISDEINQIQKAVDLLPKNIDVIIPFIKKIKFPIINTQSNRDIKKFIKLIELSAYLHYYQRIRYLCIDNFVTTNHIIIADINDLYNVINIMRDDIIPNLYGIPKNKFKEWEILKERFDINNSFDINEATEVLGFKRGTVYNRLRNLVDAGLLKTQSTPGITKPIIKYSCILGDIDNYLNIFTNMLNIKELTTSENIDYLKTKVENYDEKNVGF